MKEPMLKSTVEDIFCGPSGITIALTNGRFVWVCFSDEVDWVLYRLLEAEPMVVKTWIQKQAESL